MYLECGNVYKREKGKALIKSAVDSYQSSGCVYRIVPFSSTQCTWHPVVVECAITGWTALR